MKKQDFVLGLSQWEENHHTRPFGLHETMIMKVAPYTIKGFIYYQGEEDWSRSAFYHKMNTMVIRQWRQDFEDESLAFYITQLPMYMAKGDVDDKTGAF